MSPKILSQTGVSLADTYDVEGSIAGVEQLQSKEVSLVHEMGSTIFSERLSSFVRRGTSGSTAQSLSFTDVIDELPAGVSRVLNIFVFSDTAARVNRAQVSIRSGENGREVPLFVWNTADDSEVQLRLQDNGQSVAEVFQLREAVPLNNLPALLVKQNRPGVFRVDELVLRGATGAFGAGNVTVTVVFQIAFTHIGGISSIGLPIPSW